MSDPLTVDVPFAPSLETETVKSDPSGSENDKAVWTLVPSLSTLLESNTIGASLTFVIVITIFWDELQFVVPS